jgi:hypothetical protein
MQSLTRRELLRSTSCGFGYLALAGFAHQQASADAVTDFEGPLVPKFPHFPARAKRVIFLFMQGGPSHIDTFDYKPELPKLAETDARDQNQLYASPFAFAQHGESGIHISELFPELSNHTDDLCLINGMHTDNPAHPQATIMLHTGSINFVRPSLGSWVVYGLGTDNQNLPGFVTINPPANLGGAQNYGSAFLPAAYQATKIGAGNNPISNIRPRMSLREQRRQIDLIQAMNHDFLAKQQVNPELDGVIESYELAFRMQTSVPEMVDIRDESAATKQKYGVGEKATDRFGKQCLMARRLAEAGVRFIQVSHRGWDQHKNLSKRLPANCLATDRPIAALLSDLKERGMLDETLIVWGGEFGRQPQIQNGDGRGHNHRGYTMWMAGGGIQGGMRYGSTDPTGLYASENKVHTHDLHATILHLLGLDHERLTYRYSGRDFRLTDVHGNIVRDILA